MQTKFVEEEIKYTGSELSPHWIYKKLNLCGDAIVAFIGECEVKLSEMVDIEDVLNNEPIYSKKMLHFIVEHFNSSLTEAVLRQRLLVSIAKEVIESQRGDIKIKRDGDDLFFKDGKLSVSIASKSITSTLIHFGMNIFSEGTPVKASGLTTDMGLTNIKNIAQDIIERYNCENEEIIKAISKVRGVY